VYRKLKLGRSVVKSGADQLSRPHRLRGELVAAQGRLGRSVIFRLLSPGLERPYLDFQPRYALALKIFRPWVAKAQELGL
jgi:hypothetical protein